MICSTLGDLARFVALNASHIAVPIVPPISMTLLQRTDETGAETYEIEVEREADD